MEINEFKNLFDKNTNQSTIINNDMMTMIYTDTKSPLGTLEKKLRVTLYIFPFVLLLFGGRFLTEGSRHSPTAWLLFAILFLEFLVSLLNYAVTRKIRKPEGPVKQNLLSRVNLLENRYRWYLMLHHSMILLMAVLLEISMHYHLDSNFDGWSKVNPALRIAVYVIFFMLQYIIKRRSQKEHYGQYLEKLHQLIDEMQ